MTAKGGRSKKFWSKKSHERAFERLKEQQKSPVSYARKKIILESMTDDFVRY